MSTAERQAPEHDPCFATRDEMQTALIGLQGIFWALQMLVVHSAADGIAREDDRKGGIAALITAGEQLAKEVSERF